MFPLPTQGGWNTGVRLDIWNIIFLHLERQIHDQIYQMFYQIEMHCNEIHNRIDLLILALMFHILNFYHYVNGWWWFFSIGFRVLPVNEDYKTRIKIQDWFQLFPSKITYLAWIFDFFANHCQLCSKTSIFHTKSCIFIYLGQNLMKKLATSLVFIYGSCNLNGRVLSLWLFHLVLELLTLTDCIDTRKSWTIVVVPKKFFQELPTT